MQETLLELYAKAVLSEATDNVIDALNKLFQQIEYCINGNVKIPKVYIEFYDKFSKGESYGRK